MISNARIRHASIDFFIAAALLALFGSASLHNAGPHGELQLVLAVLMGGAGLFLRTGTAEARVIGLAAAAVTVVAGAYALVLQNDYIVGTIIAVFAIFRLWSSGTPLLAQQVPVAPPAGSMTPFDAPGPYGESPVVPAQPTPGAHQTPYFPAPAQAPYFPAPAPRPDEPA